MATGEERPDPGWFTPAMVAPLGPALEGARTVLRDLDDELPPKVRKAAASTNRLFFPLAKELAEALVEFDWLRAKTIEELGDEVDDTVAAFLRLEPGWLARIDASVDAGDDSKDLRRQLDRANRVIRKLEARIEGLTRELAESEGRVRAKFEADVERLKATIAAGRESLAEETRRATSAEDGVARLEAEVDEAGRRIDDLRNRLARKSGERPVGGESNRTPGFGRGDPIAAARDLDLIATALRPGQGQRGVIRQPDDAPQAVPTFSIPKGLQPDAVEVVQALLAFPHATTLLIDGYNVAWMVGSDPSREERRQVERAAARLVRMAEGDMSAVVVWDSSTDTSETAPGALRIVFVEDADDDIVSRARAATAPVVITADRELRNRSRAAGATVIWSEAFHAWAFGNP